MTAFQVRALLFLFALPAVFAAIANPLPAPRQITWKQSDPIPVDVSQFSLKYDQNNTILHDAFKRVVDSMSQLKWYPAGIEKPISSYEPFPTGTAKRDLVANATQGSGLSVVTVNINDNEADLQLGVNETYSLSVSSNGIDINAETVWGALHAFTTLQQIILYEDGAFHVESAVEVWDQPLFPHRGIMIDSGRNYLKIDTIKAQIDIMSLSKMNVLHWHIEDSQSWPIILKSYPQMSKGAFTERETYTIQDLADVVKYGKERGVRIVPELEAPGHGSAGWLQVNSLLVACANAWWSNDNMKFKVANEPPAGQLEILNDELYDVIKGVYDELSEVFSDNVFHVGADELNANCYNFSAITQEWFKANSSRTMKDLTQYFFDKALPIYNNTKNRRLTMWEDVVTTSDGAHSIPKDVIMQSWNNDMGNVKFLADKGYDVIVSSSSHFYLDCGYGGFVSNDPEYVPVKQNDGFNNGFGGSWCGPYKTWQTIYDYDFTSTLTDEEKSHVLGAEAALWSEQVDSVVLIQKIWPRAAALAESTWSGNRDKTGMLRTTQLTQRILNFREWLVALGYNASPLMPKSCMLNPHSCDLYYNQTILAEYDY